MPPMTVRERELMTFLARFQADHGYAPTMREIKDALRLSSVSVVSSRLDQLARKGLIEREAGKSRALRIVGGVGEPRAVEGEAVAAP